ncbi:MAG TPA: hypothetical protein VN114_12735 [Oxalicibacterium sp.]|uniref:hypothetical protein n=1 Tax=Oxalicibacterium sp. TaxID=2766525 RepID=UPI002B66A53D|nr:hypothetical protein [Oxalicibacterium sp.]HWU99373.1 hypothetical protein [Oxalicibacterium sp.]
MKPAWKNEGSRYCTAEEKITAVDEADGIDVDPDSAVYAITGSTQQHRNLRLRID